MNTKNTPMSSAPYVYDKDGNIAWDKMWTNFCTLAIEGGPPHRGTKLEFKSDNNPTTSEYQSAKTEVIRAYKLLVPYPVTFTNSGDIRLKLTTPNMAKWFATICNTENVSALHEKNYLVLPLNDDYSKSEIKNVVTVVAKAHHYWQNHRTWVAKLCIHLFNQDLEAGIWE